MSQLTSCRIKFGRPPIERNRLFAALSSSRKSKEISAREAARRLGADHKTFFGPDEKKAAVEKKVQVSLHCYFTNKNQIHDLLKYSLEYQKTRFKRLFAQFLYRLT